MWTIIHGDNLVASYTYLLNLKKNFKGEVKELGAKGLDEKELKEVIGQTGLFNASKLVVITGLPSLSIFKLAPLLEKEELVIWVDKKVNLPGVKAKILEFKDTTSKANFKLADNFSNQDLKGCLKELENLLKEKTPPELIIGILARQIRLMIQVKEGELGGINPYVASKLKGTVPKWQLVGLEKSMEKLLEVDHQIKTGRMEARLALFNYLLETI